MALPASQSRGVAPRTTWRRFIWSFGFAGRGIVTLAHSQPNFRIHVGLAALALVLGAFLRIGPTEWAIVILTIALVLAVEGVNTAIEAVCDCASPAYHPLVKQAKDVSAGAVLITACGAVLVAICVFGPRLLTLLPR
ncbi:MAG: diacylglycerol kinase family protein [Chloroflexota bacterium]